MESRMMMGKTSTTGEERAEYSPGRVEVEDQHERGGNGEFEDGVGLPSPRGYEQALRGCAVGAGESPEFVDNGGGEDGNDGEEGCVAGHDLSADEATDDVAHERDAEGGGDENEASFFAALGAEAEGIGACDGAVGHEAGMVVASSVQSRLARLRTFW